MDLNRCQDQLCVLRILCIFGFHIHDNISDLQTNCFNLHKDQDNILLIFVLFLFVDVCQNFYVTYDVQSHCHGNIYLHPASAV